MKTEYLKKMPLFSAALCCPLILISVWTFTTEKQYRSKAIVSIAANHASSAYLLTPSQIRDLAGDREMFETISKQTGESFKDLKSNIKIRTIFNMKTNDELFEIMAYGKFPEQSLLRIKAMIAALSNFVDKPLKGLGDKDSQPLVVYQTNLPSRRNHTADILLSILIGLLLGFIVVLTQEASV